MSASTEYMTLLSLPLQEVTLPEPELGLGGMINNAKYQSAGKSDFSHHQVPNIMSHSCRRGWRGRQALLGKREEGQAKWSPYFIKLPQTVRLWGRELAQSASISGILAQQMCFRNL